MQDIRYPDGHVEREVVMATSRSEAYAHFDKTAAAARQRGGVVVSRKMIGVNSPCHCGSNRKFKKCCMPLARRVNRV